MKKVYSSIVVIALVGSLFGQLPAAQIDLLSTKKITSKTEAQFQSKALGVAYLISDFSTPGDWVAANDGQTSPFGWNIGSTSNTWWGAFAGGISSTSGGNYAEVYNGDYNASDQAIGVTYTLTTTNPIDIQTLTGTDQVFLSFEQYGAKFHELQEFQISVDGVNFTTVGSNQDQDTFFGTNPNAIYPNPMTRIIDINPHIAGNAGSVWVRFSWTSKFPTSTQLDVWTTFGWFIDDVYIVTKPDNDLTATSSDWGSLGLRYYQIPQTQVAPIDFSSTVLNNGINTQTNSQLSVDVTGVASFNGASPLGLNVVAGATDSLALSTQFTPSAIGTYNFTWSVGSDQVDDVPVNNVLTGESFEVSQYIYARDRGVYEADGGGADPNGSGSGFEAGNKMQIFADQQVFGIDVVIGSSTPAGTNIYGKLYADDGSGGYMLVDQTASYTTSQADATNNATVTLLFFTSPILSAAQGFYYPMVGGGTNFYYGTSGTSPPQTSFIHYGAFGGSGNNYYTTPTAMVRLNFEPCSSSNSVTESVCNSYTSPSGTIYTTTGIYIDTIPNSVGCDSITVIDLTVNYSSSSTITQSSCGSYTLNGQTYTSSGTYTQTLTNVAGCDSSITLNLTVNPNQFSPDFTVSSNLFSAPPFAAQFTNTTPNASNYNFTWDFSDGTILQSNNSLVFHEYLYNGLYDVTLIAEDINTGCTDTIFYDDYIYCTGGTSCTHASTINQSGPITACVSDSVFLSCNTGSNYTYQWRLNGTYIPGAVDTIYYPTQTGNYSVLIMDNGCPEVSPDVSVVISSSPQTPIITSSGNITPCLGGSVTLSVPTTYSSYNWSSGGTSSSEVVTSSGSYFVTVSNSTGCEVSSPIYTINASFATPPDVCIVGVDSITNYNKVIWEKPISTAIDSFYVYKESNQANIYQKIGGTSYSDTAVFNDLSSNPAAQAYRYKLSLVDSCGIESSLGSMHKSIHLTINQGVGTTWNLIWSHYEGFTFPSYNIYRGTSSTNMTLLTTIASNLNSYTDLTAPAGQLYYQIEVVSNYTCDPLKSNYNVSRSNVVDNAEAPSIIVQQENSNVNAYPNPTQDQITIDIKGYNGDVNVEVYDLQGRLLETTTNTIVSLRKYEKGIYILKVSYGDVTEEVRVVRD